MMLTITDGDIFRWRYRNPPQHNYAYHCKSQVAIAKNGFLHDTYWSGCSYDAGWSYQNAIDTLTLEYLGNLIDLRLTHPSNVMYYASVDIVDIRHANASAGNFYIRKNAQRSATKMLETAEHQREMAVSEITRAARRITLLDDAIRQIKAGEPLDGVLL